MPKHALFNGHMGAIVSELRERFQEWADSLHFSAIHKRALIVIFLLVCVGSVAIVARGHSAPILEIAPIVIDPPKITVDVAGGVKLPGVYRLPANSRVIDAIHAAGGANPGTDTSDINLARILKDGEQIYVDPFLLPKSVAQGSGPGRPIRVVKKKSGPININRATAGELDLLPGIGPVLASRILEYRKANGPFTIVEDLLKVSGIGSAKFAQFKSKVRV